ncbi:MAG: pyridoxamine 5-phosphate oxidase-related protein, FMN-binding [Deltaproteobacteria bacterium]|nr:pyridoxamine 5-phosphate oxidase-related protein, FMN-binding [Deltaproteobacteria bacterium]
MKLSDYFEKKKGKGIIATADSSGKVGMAVYARPHFITEKTVAFIMADRLMHKNLQTNPNAAYLYMESGDRYAGKRLYLTAVKEEKDSELIDKVRRKSSCPVDKGYKSGQRYLVYFKVNKVLPLVGSK